VRHKKLLGVDACSEGRGRLEGKTAVKILVNIRKRGKRVKRTPRQKLTMPT